MTVHFSHHPPGAPPRLWTGQAGQAVGGWAALIAATLARLYLVFTLTLAGAALLPAIGSWTNYVVRTGSMRPGIQSGDVVVTSPLSATDAVSVGRVHAFIDPSRAVGEPPRVLIHRVLLDREDGTFTTAGDANRAWDSTPVPRSSILGLARLRVPWIGLPSLWMWNHEFVKLAGWLLVTVAALVIVAIDRRPRIQPPKAQRSNERPVTVHSEAHADTSRPPAPVAAASTVISARWIAMTALCLAATLSITSADAGFGAETRNPGNSWTQATRILLPYASQILADTPYVAYALDEASGTSMTDSSGNARTGTYVTPITYRQPGALTTTPGYSIALTGGSGRMISGGTAVNNPTTFSLELWFKTTTTLGGKLIGFESTQASTSSKFDRHIFMRNDGRLTYGGWTGGSLKMLTTAASYNNGVWHHLVVTVRPVPSSSNQQTSIYVDGVSVASGQTTQVSSYTGWWRVGYGALASGSNYPASANFVGNIDNVAVYTTALSANRVADHYASR